MDKNILFDWTLSLTLILFLLIIFLKKVNLKSQLFIIRTKAI